MRFLLASVLAVAASSAACGSDRPGDNLPLPRDGGTSARDGGPQARVGFDGPLLEATPTDAYQCTVARAPTIETQVLWTGFDYGTTPDGSSWFVVIAGVRPDPFAPPTSYEVRMMLVNADGSLGTPVVVAAAIATERRALAVAEVAGGLLIAWIEGDELHARVVGADGTTLSGPHTIASPGGRARDVRIVAGASGALAAWSTISNDFGEVHVRAIDNEGAPTDPSRMVLRAERRFAGVIPALARDGDGYAVMLSGAGQFSFQRLDAVGAPRGDTKTLGMTRGNFGFSDGRGALIRLDDGFIAAWTESLETASPDDETWVMIQLARLNADGNLIGNVVPLMTPELNVDHVEPALFWYGDQIALTWGRGDHIYICAGCTPNHSTKLVLIDPVQLAPASNVVTLDATGTGGGFLSRTQHGVGDLIMSASTVQYHVNNDVQDGAFSCAPN